MMSPAFSAWPRWRSRRTTSRPVNSRPPTTTLRLATEMPSVARSTRPARSSCGTMIRTVADGIASPMYGDSVSSNVVMPMTRPRMSTSGPPELPSWMSQSVWSRS